MREHQLSIQRACRVVRLSHTAYYQPPLPASRRDATVIAALTDAVARYPRWGFWKLFDRLRVEGRPWNQKHVHRVYCALRLNLPRRTRRVPRRIRQPLTAPPVLNQTWALDFMTETLYDGRRVRLLTMIDEGNREGLEAELRALTDAWLRIYNGERPHDSLGRVPPLTFLPRPSSAEKSPVELSA